MFWSHRQESKRRASASDGRGRCCNLTVDEGGDVAVSRVNANRYVSAAHRVIWNDRSRTPRREHFGAILAHKILLAHRNRPTHRTRPAYRLIQVRLDGFAESTNAPKLGE